MTAPSPNASSNDRKGLSTIQKFAVARSGNVALIFALAFPVLLLMIGLAIDYGSLIASRGVLQNAADAASFAGAKELGLADANRANVSAVVDAVVAAYVKDGTKAARDPLQIKSTVVHATGQPQQVKVEIRQTVPLIFKQMAVTLDVNAVAAIVGKPNLCLLALAPAQWARFTSRKTRPLSARTVPFFPTQATATASSHSTVHC